MTAPTWRIPNPNSSRAASGSRRASTDSNKLSTDRSFHPSSARMSARRCFRRKMSAGLSSQPSAKNWSIVFSPSPSMSSAPRLTKCLSLSVRCAGHIRPPVQRTSTSPSSATASLPHSGQWSGKWKASRSASGVRLSTSCGITSPARWTTTRSPGRTPSLAISSRLCSVTLVTVTPPTRTGASRPTGVSLPVRPTWMSMLSSVVSACSAGNLCASAQRGALATKPSRCW